MSGSAPGAGRLLVGTSGFAYKEWIGAFYPPGTKGADMLAHYATRFPSVEVNYTFQREPSEKTVTEWAARTPEGFAFAIKAHRRISHHQRLVDTGEHLGRFCSKITPLGAKLGPVLVQCPPFLRFDRAALEDFLATSAEVAPTCRFALEFRHESWSCDEVYGALAAAGAAWVVSDTDEHDAPFVRAADNLTYVRLRKSGYDAATLAPWAAELRAALDAGSDVAVYLKHEDSAAGTEMAALLASLVERGA